jgi:hypothetical protein
MKSSYLSLNVKDLGKGAALAALTAFGNSILQVVESAANKQPLLPTTGDIVLSLKLAAAAGFYYLVKNLLTNSDDKLMKKEA